MIEIGRKRPDAEATLIQRIETLEALCFKICEVTETNISNLEQKDKNIEKEIATISSAIVTLNSVAVAVEDLVEEIKAIKSAVVTLESKINNK